MKKTILHGTGMIKRFKETEALSKAASILAMDVLIMRSIHLQAFSFGLPVRNFDDGSAE